jgi:hypothetical protein
VRFCLEEHLSPKIAEAARQLGVDVVSVVELGRRGLSDEEQLTWASQERRAFVTSDYGDFRRLSARCIESGSDHAGVLFLPGSIRLRDTGAIAAAIAAYDRDHGAGMPAYMVDYLRRV